MPLYVYLGAASVCASVLLVVASVFSARGEGTVRANLARGGTPSTRELVLTAGAGDRLVGPVVAGLARWAHRFTSSGVRDRLAHDLQASGLAGRGWSVERMLAARVVIFLVGLVAALIVLAAGVNGRSVALAALVVFTSDAAPVVFVRRRATARQQQLERALPDAIDQMTVSVEAGLGLDAALARASESTRRGPLAEELRLALRDMQLGHSRGDALQRLLGRTDSADLRQVVLAIRQADRHGVSIAQILRVQAVELRDRRWARAEERAQQLPVKIVFPLVLCIMPVLFVVIIGPAAMNIVDSF